MANLTRPEDSTKTAASPVVWFVDATLRSQSFASSASSQADDMATLLDLTHYLNCVGAGNDGAHGPIDNWCDLFALAR